MESIFSDYNVEIFTEGDTYFLRYSGKEIVGCKEDLEISEEDAARAQMCEEEATLVIFEHL